MKADKSEDVVAAINSGTNAVVLAVATWSFLFLITQCAIYPRGVEDIRPTVSPWDHYAAECLGQYISTPGLSMTDDIASYARKAADAADILCAERKMHNPEKWK